MTPRLLDAYCCQGGATRGYQQAGFHVTGIDISPQPRYIGDAFIQGDAVAYIGEHGHEYDAISASPPCQRYSNAQRIQGREHPDLIAATRDALGASGRPWTIENVEAAARELRDPVVRCGAMFSLRTYRHRLFEAGGGFALPHRMHPRHVAPLAKMGRPARPGEFLHVVGNFSGAQEAREAMGMPWASREGLREAIPPAYTRWIGALLREHLAGTGESGSGALFGFGGTA